MFKQSANPEQRPLSVAVLVELFRGVGAGGHVKTWERFAEAASHFPHVVDLTVFFLGATEQTTEVAVNARFVELPPVRNSHRFRVLQTGAGATDLAGFHAPLARRLPAFDVFHATHAFAFAQTAKRVAQRHDRPLVSSLQTDIPRFAALYGSAIAHRMLGGGRFADQTVELLRLRSLLERGSRARLDGLLRHCDYVLTSRREDVERLSAELGEHRIARLRRGIDKHRFNPVHRDRMRLNREFAIAPNRPVLLFVGRIDDTKGARTAALAVERLAALGIDAVLLAVGDGRDRNWIADRLGHRAVLPGPVPQKDLAWIYASSDLFLFPSETDVMANAVIEARASGLPALVMAHEGAAQMIAAPGRDGLVIDTTDPASWAKAASSLLNDRPRLEAMGRAARHHTETAMPGWRDVLLEDLLPVWQAAYQQRQSVAPRAVKRAA